MLDPFEPVSLEQPCVLPVQASAGDSAGPEVATAEGAESYYGAIEA